MKRDLRYMITAGVKHNIPVVIGTAGGSGAAPHLEWCRQIILEIAQEENLSFSLALIPSDVDKAIVHQALDNGKITALEFVPELTHDAIEESIILSRKWGLEPFQRALKAGAASGAGRTRLRSGLLCGVADYAGLWMKDWRCTAVRSWSARRLPPRGVRFRLCDGHH
ncbi:Uncharacterised protein [Salmonella enterica subsp. indica]|uniref:Uncharacterized protein n=1 Tax=Salmonella enterica subsp. indica TaxID=59207 RepID=A0A379XU38_SALER|nr:Uncharacterised protein [Salmonella enterica subsp. indica]